MKRNNKHPAQKGILTLPLAAAAETQLVLVRWAGGETASHCDLLTSASLRCLTNGSQKGSTCLRIVQWFHRLRVTLRRAVAMPNLPFRRCGTCLGVLSEQRKGSEARQSLCRGLVVMLYVLSLYAT